MSKFGIELAVSVERKDKHPLEELVTKRVRLTQKEYSDIMFYLEIMVDLYQTMKEDNPGNLLRAVHRGTLPNTLHSWD